MGKPKIGTLSVVAILWTVLVILPEVLFAADVQEEEGVAPQETAIQAPAGQQLNLGTLFDMQGLRLLHEELKGATTARSNSANAPKRLLPLGSVTGFKSIGGFKNLTAKNPGWYWCGCRVDLNSNIPLPVGAHAAIAHWNGTGFSWSTTFGPDGVGQQQDLATNETFEFFKIEVQQGVDDSFSGFYPRLYALQEAWKGMFTSNAFTYDPMPWDTPGRDANCNVYGRYLMLGLGLKGSVPRWHHGAEVANRVSFTDARGQAWEALGILNKHPNASESLVIYMEPQEAK